jgi:hypothetical protein
VPLLVYGTFLITCFLQNPVPRFPPRQLPASAESTRETERGFATDAQTRTLENLKREEVKREEAFVFSRVSRLQVSFPLFGFVHLWPSL